MPFSPESSAVSPSGPDPESGERTRVARPILGSQRSHRLVVAVRHGGSKRLIQSCHDDQQRLGIADGRKIDEAIHAEMVTLRPVDANFEPPRHVAVHCLPIPATGEPVWRRGSDSLQDRCELGPHTRGALAQELAGWNGFRRVVFVVPLEVNDLVRVVAIRYAARRKIR